MIDMKKCKELLNPTKSKKKEESKPVDTEIVLSKAAANEYETFLRRNADNGMYFNARTCTITDKNVYIEFVNAFDHSTIVQTEGCDCRWGRCDASEFFHNFMNGHIDFERTRYIDNIEEMRPYFNGMAQVYASSRNENIPSMETFANCVRDNEKRHGSLAYDFAPKFAIRTTYSSGGTLYLDLLTGLLCTDPNQIGSVPYFLYIENLEKIKPYMEDLVELKRIKSKDNYELFKALMKLCKYVCDTKNGVSDEQFKIGHQHVGNWEYASEFRQESERVFITSMTQRVFGQHPYNKQEAYIMHSRVSKVQYFDTLIIVSTLVEHEYHNSTLGFAAEAPKEPYTKTSESFRIDWKDIRTNDGMATKVKKLTSAFI